jgi:hypothetical protein
MLKRNMFLMWINSFTLRVYTETRCELSSYELNGAIGQQNGNAIDNRITLPAALAPYGLFFKLQGLVADRADDPAQMLFRQ